MTREIREASDGRVAQDLLEVLVESALVREAGQRVAPSLGVRQREPALVRERLRGEVGDSRDELRVAERLDARRKRHENGSEGLRVGDQRNRNRLGTGRAEPVELAQLVCVSLDEAELRVRAGDDVRRRMQRLGRARPRQGGQRKRAFGRCEVDRRERRAGEVGELARDEVGRAAAARRAGDRVRQPDERLARPCQGALELPQRSALQAVRVSARLEHRHHIDDVVRSCEGDDPGPRQQVADPLRRLDAVEDRHLDVHQDDVRAQGRSRRNCFVSPLGLAHDLDLPLLREAGLDGLTRVRRVVADQQTKHSTPSTRHRRHSKLWRLSAPQFAL